MQLQSEVFGDVIVLHTPEELCRDCEDMFPQLVNETEQTKVVFDLDGTEMIDSIGLELLLSAREQMRERQGNVKLSTTNRHNRKILEISRVDQEIEVFDSVIEAVKSFVNS